MKRPPTLAMVGEAGPEAIIPLSRLQGDLGWSKPCSCGGHLTLILITGLGLKARRETWCCSRCGNQFDVVP